MAYGENVYGLLYKGELTPEDVPLTGTRVFQWRPDWRDPVTLSYRTSTIISESYKHVEQRRAQYAAMKRALSFTVADDEYLPAVENFLRLWHSDTVWVPLWPERCVVTTAALIGQTVIAVEDCSELFGLNNLDDYVCILDRNLVLAPEVFAVSTVAAEAVTLATAVTGAYTSANAMLFPALRAVLENNNLTDVTAHYGQYSLSWKEWF